MMSETAGGGASVLEVPEVVVTPEQDLPLPPPPPPGEVNDDELSLLVDGRIWRGWDDIVIARSCERMPSSFTISLTERLPGEAEGLIIEPGASCVVRIGRDTVLTGYVDRYVPSIDAATHRVAIMGRSKCQDLVDCSAIIENHQLSGLTVRAIAEVLAAPYGITVSAPKGDGPVIPQFNLLFGDTPFDVIERLCRFARFLCYDDEEGNLVLSPVGTEAHASGVREGDNLLAATGTFGADNRYSEYRVHLLSTTPLFQGDQAAGSSGVAAPAGTATDEGVKRLRRLSMILEHAGPDDPIVLAKQRAEWEAARRRGRAEVLTARIDTWRDSAGELWKPNRLVTVMVASCKVRAASWIIGEVIYRRGAGGTSAELMLMPPAAFDPQYVPYLPFDFQIAAAAAQSPTVNPRAGEGPGL
jgi:prophage tail gpP-like protein